MRRSRVLSTKQRTEVERSLHSDELALAKRRDEFNRGDVGALQLAIRIARCYKQLGNPTEARVVLSKVLELAIQNHGAASDIAVVAASNLIATLARLGAFDKVTLNTTGQVIKARLADQDDDSVPVRRHLYLIGDVLRYIGEFDFSRQLYVRVRRGGMANGKAVGLVVKAGIRATQAGAGVRAARRTPGFDPSARWRRDVARGNVPF